MTVKQAQERIEELEQLANNVRLLNQWALNADEALLEEIETKHGMNSTIPIFTTKATNELYQLVESMKEQFNNTELSIQEYPFMKKGDKHAKN